MKKLNQAGSHLVIIIVAVVVLAVAGFAGWKVLSKDKKSDNTNNSSDTSQTQGTDESSKNELTKTYTHTADKFRVMYPENWIETTKTDNSEPDYPTTDTEIKSPDGSIVHIKTDFGGRGGVCEPDEADTPHKAGNNCPTREYLYKEAISAKTYDEEMRDGKTKTPIYLIRARTTNSEGKSTYTVGLETDRENLLKLNEPEMGLVVSYSFFTFVNQIGEFKGLIYAYAECDTPDNFATSSDCGTAENILRSFSFY